MQGQALYLLDARGVGRGDADGGVGERDARAQGATQQRDGLQPTLARLAPTTFLERPLVLIATSTSPGWPKARTPRANTS